MRNRGITYLGRTTFRNHRRLFGILDEDRRHHMYLVGQSGTGKSTLLESITRQDLVNGRGFALIDPHGDLASCIAITCPDRRKGQLVYWDLPDSTVDVSFNPLAASTPETRILAASGVLDVFKKLWLESWGPRLEHLMRYSLLALVETPGASLADIMRLLVEDTFRKRVAEPLMNGQVREYWLRDYERMSKGERSTAIAPIENKVGAFLAHPRLRSIFCDNSDSRDLRELMDRDGVLVVNLSKGRLGEDATALFGALLVSTLARLGLERADQPEEYRRDFTVVCDEAQLFTTLSVANMLAELRKYRVQVALANQYLNQLAPEVRDAVFGNVGTVVAFRIGASDAKVLAQVLDADLEPGDLMRLPNHHAYMRLMVHGSPVQAFSAETLRV